MPSTARLSLSNRICASVVCIVAWFAVLLQLYLNVGTITNFFSYFTILCNLLIVICLSYSLLIPGSRAGSFFSRPSVQTAIALYIFIVGLVYNTVLRRLWEPTGWQLLADNLLHVIVPIMFVLYWLFFVPRGQITWKNGLYWLWFPLLYLVYSLIRGYFVLWYPYPFLDIDKLGIGKVLLNSSLVLIAFLVVGLLFLAINRLKKR